MTRIALTAITASKADIRRSLVTGSGSTAEPFLRISYDNGNTFGQKIMLSNATTAAIGSATSGGSK